MGWQENSIFQVLIVTGTSPFSGLFVYSGAPALGNPPIFAVTTSSHDPYGNTVTANAVTDSGMPFLLYSAAPALGNLILSLAPTAGTDGFGNVFQAGFAVYTANSSGDNYYSTLARSAAGDFLAAGSPLLLFQCTNLPFSQRPGIGVTGDSTSGTTIAMNSGKATAGATASQIALADSVLSGIANGTVTITDGETLINAASAAGRALQIQNSTAAPSSSNLRLVNAAAGDLALGILVLLDSNQRWGVDSNGAISWGTGATTPDTTLARVAAAVLKISNALGFANAGSAPAAIASTPILYAAGLTPGRLHHLSPSGLDSEIVSSLTDSTTFTVTQATLHALSNAYTIPAADAIAGSTYTLWTGGTGTWGSTQQTLTLGVDLNGANSIQSNILNTAFAVSTAIQWSVLTKIIITATGSGGNALMSQDIRISPGGNHGIADSVAYVHTVSAVAFNTTVANTLALGALWAATTGAPTISSFGSEFTRSGP